MATPRRKIVDPRVPGLYHCHSRCVRRALLCGDGCDHRRDWIQQRLRELAGLFAIDVGGYAVMSNHLHVVLWTEPGRPAGWSSREVARRWLTLFPGPLARDGTPGAFEAAVERLAGNAARIRLLRRRLSDLSWFMRCLCEPIARRANEEDDCTGRFWEGRFKSHRLLDEAAVVACLVYVDLNVIRAKLARTPEESDHTSVQDRIRVRRYARRPGSPRDGDGAMAALLPHLPADAAPRHDEDGIWLAPIQRSPEQRRRRQGGDARPGGRRDRRRRRPVTGPRRGLLNVTLDRYLELVDRLGRIVRGAAKGAIPSQLRPILERLELDGPRWIEFLREPGKLIGTAIGSAESLAKEAARRGCSRGVNPMPVYLDSPEG